MPRCDLEMTGFDSELPVGDSEMLGGDSKFPGGDLFMALGGVRRSIRCFVNSM